MADEGAGAGLAGRWWTSWAGLSAVARYGACFRVARTWEASCPLFIGAVAQSMKGRHSESVRFRRVRAQARRAPLRLWLLVGLLVAELIVFGALGWWLA